MKSNRVRPEWTLWLLIVDEIDYLRVKEAQGQEIVDEIDYLRAKEAQGQEIVEEID